MRQPRSKRIRRWDCGSHWCLGTAATSVCPHSHHRDADCGRPLTNDPRRGSPALSSPDGTWLVQNLPQISPLASTFCGLKAGLRLHRPREYSLAAQSQPSDTAACKDPAEQPSRCHPWSVEPRAKGDRTVATSVGLSLNWGK